MLWQRRRDVTLVSSQTKGSVVRKEPESVPESRFSPLLGLTAAQELTWSQEKQRFMETGAGRTLGGAGRVVEGRPRPGSTEIWQLQPITSTVPEKHSHFWMQQRGNHGDRVAIITLSAGAASQLHSDILSYPGFFFFFHHEHWFFWNWFRWG